MTERARRIDILGPAEVAQAAEELADSIRRDVTIATKLKKLTEAKLPSAAERMTNETAPAMAAAREAVQETRRQMRDLVGETNESGRPLHEDPRTAELFANFERAQEVADAAIARAHEDGDRISAFLDQATVIVDELKRNQEARAYTRERFTTAARHTLASANPPTS